MLLNDKDRYGFYNVGAFKTYSKLDAIEHHAVTKQPITWNYNKEFYQNFDWTQEPPGSLESWYRARAQQIREQYDYIVLWYSGGADSANILDTFVTNGIFIDEIAQFTAVNSANHKDSYINQEIFCTSVPITQRLLAHDSRYKNTQHRVVDLSNLMQTLMLDPVHKWDFFYHVNRYWGINSLSRHKLRDSVPEYKKLIDSGKKVCFIWGVEKPFVSKQNNYWYIHFKDGLDHCLSAYSQMLNRPWEYDEFFYWPPDMPALPAKQAHVLRRYLEQVGDKDIDGIHVIGGKPPRPNEYGLDQQDLFLNKPVITIEKNNHYYSLSFKGMHRLLYPNWQPDLLVAGKPHGHLFNPKDAWLFGTNAPDCGQMYYARAVPKIRQTVKQANPMFWKEFKFDPGLGPYVGGIIDFENVYCLGAAQ